LSANAKFQHREIGAGIGLPRIEGKANARRPTRLRLGRAPPWRALNSDKSRAGVQCLIETEKNIDFAASRSYSILVTMSATEIIEQFKALPASERAQVAKFVVENDDSWIPESFKQGMADAEAGRFVDLDTALNEPYPGGK
jgi:hypothetical protein